MGRVDKNKSLYEEVMNENNKLKLSDIARMALEEEYPKELPIPPIDFDSYDELVSYIDNCTVNSYDLDKRIDELFRAYKLNRDLACDFLGIQLNRLTNCYYYVTIRILDPRVCRFSCYGKLDDKIIKDIKSMYIIDVDYDKLGNITSIRYLGNDYMGFTIYNCNNYNEVKDLYMKHYESFNERKLYDMKNHVLY